MSLSVTIEERPERKSEYKGFMIAPSDLRKIQREAQRRRMTFSQFIRNCVLDAIENVEASH